MPLSIPAHAASGWRVYNETINGNVYEDALEEGDWSLVASEVARIGQRRGEGLREGSETHALVAEAVIRAKLAAIVGRERFLRDKPSEPPATFVRGGIDARTLQPVAHLPRPRPAARSKGGKMIGEAAAEFIAERQRDPAAALRRQTQGQHEMTFRLFADYCHNAPVASARMSSRRSTTSALRKAMPLRCSGTSGLSALQEIVEKINYPTLRLDHLYI
jgi:hypothetical protein